MKQALLRSVTGDGTVVELVVLDDDRCAVLRNGRAEHVADGDEAGIDAAVQRFTALTLTLTQGDGAQPGDDGADAPAPAPAAPVGGVMPPAAAGPGTSA